jgi:hypothetical protein
MVASASVPFRPLVGILFSPRSLFLIDVFRTLGAFEEHYDLASLDALERRLAQSIDPSIAKGLVSDALLLSFGLRRERQDQLDFAPTGSRRGTADEYRLVALVGAAYRNDPALAAEAALALGVANYPPLITLACDIANRLKMAGIAVDDPDGRLISSEAGAGAEATRIDLDEDRPFVFEHRVLTLVVH